MFQIPLCLSSTSFGCSASRWMVLSQLCQTQTTRYIFWFLYRYSEYLSIKICNKLKFSLKVDRVELSDQQGCLWTTTISQDKILSWWDSNPWPGLSACWGLLIQWTRFFLFPILLCSYIVTGGRYFIILICWVASSTSQPNRLVGRTIATERVRSEISRSRLHHASVTSSLSDVSCLLFQILGSDNVCPLIIHVISNCIDLFV